MLEATGVSQEELERVGECVRLSRSLNLHCAVYSPAYTRQHWTAWLARLGSVQKVEYR